MKLKNMDKYYYLSIKFSFSVVPMIIRIDYSPDVYKEEINAFQKNLSSKQGVLC